MSAIAPRIEYREVNELLHYPGNAWTHSDAQITMIANSIREYGFTNPVLVDAAGVIIAGHGRVRGAQQVGMSHVPCVSLDWLTPAQCRAYRLADNQIGLMAGWDEDILAAEIKALQDIGYDISLSGFDDDFLQDLIAPHQSSETGDVDSVPSPPQRPVSANGDVWIMGRHKLMCGDSCDSSAVAHFMASDRSTLLITDPPYNVSYKGKAAEELRIENDNMSRASFRRFLTDAYASADAVMCPGAVFYIWHSDSYTDFFRSAAIEAKWRISQCLIWAKNHFALGRSDYHFRHEPCLYGWKEGAPHFWGGDRSQSTVLEFDRPHVNDVHPTMKPLALFEYLICNSSKPGGVVLDTFAGSGTTLLACDNTGRTNRSIEIDPRYCDVIIQRWQKHSGGVAVLQGTDLAYSRIAAERGAI